MVPKSNVPYERSEWKQQGTILIDDILNLFANEPELIKINQNIPKDEGMLKSLKRDEEFQNLIDKNEK